MSNAYETVLQQANIRDVLSNYGIAVNGNKCLCPFHDDKNPSMYIDNKRNIVKCFSCGEGGNAISFIKKYENKINNNSTFSTADAVKKAAEICHINVDLTNLKSEDNKKSEMYDNEQKEILESNSYFATLFNYDLSTTDGEECVEYLHSRGISDEIAKNMKLGFSAERNFGGVINEKAQISALTDTRIRNRLIIPIADEYGNIVAFSGRTIHGEEPKYLLTQETKVFHKSEILFNYSNAKSQSYGKELFIVEGFMDVIGSKKLGIDNVVALMGTAITSKHIELLKKLKCELVLALDNDEAGKRAMLKQIPILLQEGFRVSVIDISKVGNYKDFGDIGNTNIKASQIIAFKESALQFLIENKYLESNKTSSIQKAYFAMRKDGLIKNKGDEVQFIEIAMQHNPTFSKEDYYNLIHPSEIEKPKKDGFTELRDKLLTEYFFNCFKEYVSKYKGERVETAFIQKNNRLLSKKCYELFINNPNKYIKDLCINVSDVIKDTLKNDKEYLEFKEKEYFPYEKAFNNVTYFTDKGYAKIVLNDEQKNLIVRKFNSDQENYKVNLEDCVEEIYIINSLRKESLFSKATTKSKMYSEIIIPEKLKNHRFAVYPYSSLFSPEHFPYVDAKFKTADGKNYKDILIFSDIERELHLTNANLLINQKSEKIEKNLISKDNISIHDQFAYVNVNDGYIKINVKNLKQHDSENYELKCPLSFKFSLYSKENKFQKQLTVPEINAQVKKIQDRKQHEESIKKNNDFEIEKE